MIIARSSTGNFYKFPVTVQDDHDDDCILVYVGGNNGLPACILFLLYPETKSCVLQDFVHRDHCCSNKKLERGTEGMKVLGKAALKFIIEKYPWINKVQFTDKSQYDDVWLPEIKVLTEGQTWYQKHLGAQPNKTTSEVLARYKKVRRVHPMDDVPFEKWTKEYISDLIKKYNLQQLSGRDWYITKKTVLNYDVTIENSSEQTGGSNRAKQYFRYRLVSSIHV